MELVDLIDYGCRQLPQLRQRPGFYLLPGSDEPPQLSLLYSVRDIGIIERELHISIQIRRRGKGIRPFSAYEVPHAHSYCDGPVTVFEGRNVRQTRKLVHKGVPLVPEVVGLCLAPARLLPDYLFV